jgi:hypothetical protein
LLSDKNSTLDTGRPAYQITLTFTLSLFDGLYSAGEKSSQREATRARELRENEREGSDEK